VVSKCPVLIRFDFQHVFQNQASLEPSRSACPDATPLHGQSGGDRHAEGSAGSDQHSHGRSQWATTSIHGRTRDPGTLQDVVAHEA